MRLELHVHHHHVNEQALSSKLDLLARAIFALTKSNGDDMEKLREAVAALTAEVEPIKNKLDAAETAIQRFPEVVAAAVADALAAANVEGDALADAVDAARTRITEEVDQVTNAINAGTEDPDAPAEEPTPETPAEDPQPGGGSTDPNA